MQGKTILECRTVDHHSTRTEELRCHELQAIKHGYERHDRYIEAHPIKAPRLPSLLQVRLEAYSVEGMWKPHRVYLCTRKIDFR